MGSVIWSNLDVGVSRRMVSFHVLMRSQVHCHILKTQRCNKMAHHTQPLRLVLLAVKGLLLHSDGFLK